MKLEKTVEGLFAAPLTVPTTANGPRMRELEADVRAKVPELADLLQFAPSAATKPHIVFTQPVSLGPGVAYSVTLSSGTTFPSFETTK